ncbi:uncharacterized protein C1orf159 homolog isoform X3 [Eumetopias jubatus]|uniref:uncharacterized protein C1orf159 homolog isoform X3 n=1 Tax=Eumetopias jubatus TaxID=34886 RepID=UPI001016DC6E|nr:uncharacterized protein C1orf159 homolog isoform X3 [Eumetopias jubatus]
MLCGRGGCQHHLREHKPVWSRLLQAPERERERQLRPLQEQHLQPPLPRPPRGPARQAHLARFPPRGHVSKFRRNGRWLGRTVPTEQEHRNARAAKSRFQRSHGHTSCLCLRVRKPPPHREPSGGSLPLPGDALRQLWPHPVCGWVLLPEAHQQTPQGLLREKQSSCPAAWRSRCHDSPATALSAEAALCQARAALGQGHGPHCHLLGGGPGQQRLTRGPTHNSAHRLGENPAHKGQALPSKASGQVLQVLVHPRNGRWPEAVGDQGRGRPGSHLPVTPARLAWSPWTCGGCAARGPVPAPAGLETHRWPWLVTDRRGSPRERSTRGHLSRTGPDTGLPRFSVGTGVSPSASTSQGPEAGPVPLPHRGACPKHSQSAHT